MPVADNIILTEGLSTMEGRVIPMEDITAIDNRGELALAPSTIRDAVDEKYGVDEKTGSADGEITVGAPLTYEGSDTDGVEKERDLRDPIIITGADAAHHLLPMRDDFDPALTFRSMFLATGLAAFQAVMYQIYMVRPHYLPHALCSPI